MRQLLIPSPITCKDVREWLNEIPDDYTFVVDTRRDDGTLVGIQFWGCDEESRSIKITAVKL